MKRNLISKTNLNYQLGKWFYKQQVWLYISIVRADGLAPLSEPRLNNKPLHELILANISNNSCFIQITGYNVSSMSSMANSWYIFAITMPYSMKLPQEYSKSKCWYIPQFQWSTNHLYKTFSVIIFWYQLVEVPSTPAKSTSVKSNFLNTARLVWHKLHSMACKQQGITFLLH